MRLDKWPLVTSHTSFQLKALLVSRKQNWLKLYTWHVKIIKGILYFKVWPTYLIVHPDSVRLVTVSVPSRCSSTSITAWVCSRTMTSSMSIRRWSSDQRRNSPRSNANWRRNSWKVCVVLSPSLSICPQWSGVVMKITRIGLMQPCRW